LLSSAQTKIRRAEELLPADVLDVIVHANGQSHAALQAPTLEYNAAIRSGHTLAKTMHAHAPPDLGLISTLGHLTYSKKDKLLRTASKREPVVFSGSNAT
jgi:hypothetical protein